MDKLALQNIDICRFCLNRDEKLFDIFKKYDEQQADLAHQVVSVVSLEVFADDGYPNKICSICKTLIHNAYRFKQICKKADTMLKVASITGKIPDAIALPKDMLPNSKSTDKTSKQSIGIQTDEIEDEMIETIVEALDDADDVNESTSYQIIEEVDGNSRQQVSYTIIEPMDENIDYALLRDPVVIKKEEDSKLEPVKILNREHKSPTKPVKVLNKPKPKILNKEFNTPKKTQVAPSLQLMDSIIQHSEDGSIEIITEVSNYEKPSSRKSTDSQDPFKSAETVPTNVFSCNMCERSFPLEQLLEIHLKNHTRERNHSCSFCDKKFLNKYDLGKHIPTHTGERPYQCIVCNKSFSRSTLLTRHEKIHKDVVKIQCTMCDRQFLKEDEYKKHIEKHNKTRPFACTQCDKKFAFKQGLERHEVIHVKDHPHKCQYCDLSFPTAGKLQRHVAKHAGDRPYPCKLCNKSFLLSHHLTRHLRSHQGDTFKCNECNKCFEDRSSFIDHIETHAVDIMTCSLCSKVFADISEIPDHIRLHKQNKIFTCDYCDMTFTDENEMNEHCMQDHSNEMCTVIPISEIDKSLDSEGEVIEEYVVEEQELKPVRRGAKRKAGQSITMLPEDADDFNDQFLVMVEEDESQDEPKIVQKKVKESTDIQEFLNKLPKGMTIKKEPLTGKTIIRKVSRK